VLRFVYFSVEISDKMTVYKCYSEIEGSNWFAVTKKGFTCSPVSGTLYVFACIFALMYVL